MEVCQSEPMSFPEFRLSLKLKKLSPKLQAGRLKKAVQYIQYDSAARERFQWKITGKFFYLVSSV